MDIKIKGYSSINGMSKAMSLKELISSQIDLDQYDTLIQYLGFCDANKRELYKGDIIELTITEDLMDPHKESFYNSNLGKYITKEGNITSVVCAIRENDTSLCTYYDLYCLQNDKIIRRKKGNLSIAACDEDSRFPQYLIKKGATYIGNIIETPELLQKRGETWKLPDLCYVECSTNQELMELITRFGYDNICSPYFEHQLSLQEEINKIISYGYCKFLFEKERLDCIQMLRYDYNFNTSYPTIEFADFKQSDIWKQKEQNKITDLSEDFNDR